MIFSKDEQIYELKEALGDLLDDIKWSKDRGEIENENIFEGYKRAKELLKDIKEG